MSPSLMLPSSGSCSVAMVRINVDLPAPFGPRRPNRPRGMSRLTALRATVPFEYVFERPSIFSIGVRSGFVSEDDTPAGEIVWRDFDGHAVPLEHPDAKTTHVAAK